MANWYLAPSLVVLRDQMNTRYPGRKKVSDGAIGDVAHQAVPSDHNPNSVSVVCALDITHDPASGVDAHELANNLLQSRHPQLKYLISNGRIAGQWTNWQWDIYRGSNSHDKHIHISVGVGDDGKSKPGTYESTQQWVLTKGAIMPNDGWLRALHRITFAEPATDEWVKGYLASNKDVYVVTQEVAEYALSKGIAHEDTKRKLAEAEKQGPAKPNPQDEADATKFRQIKELLK